MTPSAPTSRSKALSVCTSSGAMTRRPAVDASAPAARASAGASSGSSCSGPPRALAIASGCTTVTSPSILAIARRSPPTARHTPPARSCVAQSNQAASDAPLRCS
eukprot:7229469-Prymnesium_polylepis.1